MKAFKLIWLSQLQAKPLSFEGHCSRSLRGSVKKTYLFVVQEGYPMTEPCSEVQHTFSKRDVGTIPFIIHCKGLERM